MYKQKIKHLQHEHLNAITELNADSLAASEMLEKEQEQLEAELRKAVTRVDVQEVNIEEFDQELELVCSINVFHVTLIIGVVQWKDTSSLLLTKARLLSQQKHNEEMAARRSSLEKLLEGRNKQTKHSGLNSSPHTVKC